MTTRLKITAQVKRDMALVEAAITASGVSAARFAAFVVGRDERTVRRWRHGKKPLPGAARMFLEQYVKASQEAKKQGDKRPIYEILAEHDRQEARARLTRVSAGAKVMAERMQRD